MFLSHAVADEAFVLPVVDFLRRHYATSIFVCADSIPESSTWHRTLVTELEAAELIVFLLSTRSKASTFCAFEVGYGLALQKKFLMVSIDSSTPPAYIQHLQMYDVPRMLLSLEEPTL